MNTTWAKASLSSLRIIQISVMRNSTWKKADEQDFKNFINSTLAKIAIAGGFFIALTGYAMRHALQSKLTKSPYYGEALDALRDHSYALSILGEPFEVGSVEVGESRHFGSDENTSWATIPVKGTKTTGELKYWVKKEENLEDSYISRIEIAFGNIKDKKLLIRNKVVSE